MRIITSELLEMTYNELCNYYIKKYGNVKYDYFSTPECKSVQKKNSRTKEGLEIHHIDENRHPLLSAGWAKDMPFECQKADRLVYVNVLEHLLLHIKIYKEECGKSAVTGKQAILGHPGVYYLSQRINDYFEPDCQPKGWHENMAKVISENYEDYINVLFYHLDRFTAYNKKRKELLSEIDYISKRSNGDIDRKLNNKLIKRYYNFLPYTIGDKVVHDKFGIGMIYFIREVSGHTILKIKFDEYGNKEILESYDNMKRIDYKKSRS
jgi:transcription-repair coupling factor (superfamily II helicase)